VSVCACMRVKERDTDARGWRGSACRVLHNVDLKSSKLCVCERERESVCVCVCVRVCVRERECVCACEGEGETNVRE